MFSQFVEKALHQATYELISDGTYWGKIPGFTGVWANEGTIEGCRDELRSVLEEWLLLGVEAKKPASSPRFPLAARIRD